MKFPLDKMLGLCYNGNSERLGRGALRAKAMPSLQRMRASPKERTRQLSAVWDGVDRLDPSRALGRESQLDGYNVCTHQFLHSRFKIRHTDRGFTQMFSGCHCFIN